MPMQVVTCQGQSGKTYELDVDKVGAAYESISGVYVFSRLAPNGKWDALYIGETDDLDNTLNRCLKIHPRLACLRRENATHVGTLLVKDEKERYRVAMDLRRAMDPVCNRSGQ